MDDFHLFSGAVSPQPLFHLPSARNELISAAFPNPVWHFKMEGTARIFVPAPSWHWQGTFSALQKDKCADLFCPLALNRGCYVTPQLWGLPEHTPYITPQQVAIEERPLNLPLLFLMLLAKVSGGCSRA